MYHKIHKLNTLFWAWYGSTSKQLNYAKHLYFVVFFLVFYWYMYYRVIFPQGYFTSTGAIIFVFPYPKDVVSFWSYQYHDDMTLLKVIQLYVTIFGQLNIPGSPTSYPTGQHSLCPGDHFTIPLGVTGPNFIKISMSTVYNLNHQETWITINSEKYNIMYE